MLGCARREGGREGGKEGGGKEGGNVPQPVEERLFQDLPFFPFSQ